MTEQSNAAAERSAHVARTATRALDVPVVEVAPGVWKLRAVAELEAERDAAFVRGWEAGREAAATLAAEAPEWAVDPDTDWDAAGEEMAEAIRAMTPPPGEARDEGR